MTGYEYEEFCADYLEKMGFYNIKVTKASGDQGVDITAFKNSIKYAFQCKYYESPVGNKAVQEVFAGKEFYDCQKAVVITNNTFTPSAVELANKNGVELWNSIYPTYDEYEASNELVSFIISDNEFKNFTSDDLFKKYNEYEQYFRDAVRVIDNEEILRGLRNIDSTKRVEIKKQVDLVFSLLTAAEHISGVFLTDYTVGFAKTVLGFSREKDIPISYNMLMMIQSHFNFISSNYNIYIERIDSISFKIIVKGKPWLFNKDQEYTTYLNMLKVVKDEEAKTWGIRIIDDGNRSKVLYNKMVVKICDFLNYSISCLASPNKEVLIDPLYIVDKRVGLISATFCHEDNYVRFYFVSKLNNRARYDKRYEGIYDKTLLLVVKMHVCDYFVYNNEITFLRAPTVSYSFESGGEAFIKKIFEVNPDTITFVNRQLFVTAIDEDIEN